MFNIKTLLLAVAVALFAGWLLPWWIVLLAAFLAVCGAIVLPSGRRARADASGPI